MRLTPNSQRLTSSLYAPFAFEWLKTSSTDALKPPHSKTKIFLSFWNCAFHSICKQIIQDSNDVFKYPIVFSYTFFLLTCTDYFVIFFIVQNLCVNKCSCKQPPLIPCIYLLALPNLKKTHGLLQIDWQMLIHFSKYCNKKNLKNMRARYLFTFPHINHHT